VTSRRFQNLVRISVVVILIVGLAPMEVHGRDELVDENYFDIRVTLRFDDGEFVDPGTSFDIEYDGSWADVGLQANLVQVRGAFIDFVYLKINGETVLFTTGSIRIHTSTYGNDLEIEAYGEAFVSYTDAYYKDSVGGSLLLLEGSESLLASLGAVVVILVAVFGVSIVGIWWKRKATQ